ncbi:MAG: hypothetical protein QOD36_4432 [Mycobacterium sp.]|jgi:hypothetical protein|nr:hypothetical protein [Mycobacterium sp.]MDT5247056.1 hypothetical protein [Mycobacterium sp.]MDT5329500.1 hypothetical protein [Mycobacterium sp.]
MSTAAAPVTRAVSTAFGLVMVASAAVQADGPGLIAAVAASSAVLAGSVFRPAATIAVLFTVSVIVLADVPPLLTATSGLCAAAYLVLRHTAAVTPPTVVGAVGFTAAGLAAASLPIQLPWVPLLAPLAVLVLFVLVTRPFWAT